MNLHDKKIYSTKAILALAAAINRNEEAFQWLLENDEKELAAFADVWVYWQADAMDWLKQNGFNNLVAFIGALDEDDDSINYLMNNEGKNWAATAEMVNGSDTAPDWLRQFFPAFGALADSLIANPRYRGRRGIIGSGFGAGGYW
jgi:hypothetical protein